MKRQKTPCDDTAVGGSAKFYFPIQFGKQFLLAAIKRNEGNDSSLGGISIHIDSKPAESKQLGKNMPMVATLNYTSAELLWKWQMAMEQLLFTTVRPRLRGYLLVKLAEMNHYRRQHQGIIQSLDPFSEGTNPTDLQFLALLETGSYALSLSTSPCGEWKECLEQAYPSCRVEVIHEHECVPGDHHSQARMRPHIILSGPVFDDVYECRLLLESYIESSRRLRVGGRRPCV